MANKALGSILNDIGAGTVQQLLGQSIPTLGYPISLVGATRHVTGALQDKPDMDQNQVSGYAWIPTQAAARMGKRRALLSNAAGSKNKWKPLHQIIAPGAQLAGGTVLGALAGAFSGIGQDQNTINRRAFYGALSGMGITAGAHLIAAIAAACTPKRTLKQQKQYEQSGAQTAANYLVPGRSTYNGWKSIGVMLGDQYQKARKKDGKKKGVSKKAGLQKTTGTQEWWSHEGAGKGVKIGGITGATITGVPAFARWTLLRGGNPVLKLLGGLIDGTIAAGAGALGGGIIGGAAGGLFGPKKKKNLPS